MEKSSDNSALTVQNSGAVDDASLFEEAMQHREELERVDEEQYLEWLPHVVRDMELHFD